MVANRDEHRQPVIQGVHRVIRGNPSRGFGSPGGGLCVFHQGITKIDPVYDMDVALYISYFIVLLIAYVGSRWLDSLLQPIISVDWVQQVLIDTSTFLFLYIIMFWGVLVVTAVFHNRTRNSVTDRFAKAASSFTSELITYGALVGIPLTLIIGAVIKVALL